MATALTAAVLPLGVYCPGELVDWVTITRDPETKVVTETIHHDALHRDLAKLQSESVNCIWLTHLSAGTTADVAKLAKPFGISVVAALAELDGSVPHHRTRTAAQIADLADETAVAWGNAPQPLAWGMCDEPKTEYMPELRSYINSWWSHIGGPVTTVPSWAHLESASEIGCEFQTHFLYPFRHDGTSGYSVTPHQAWLRSCTDNVRLNKRAWGMGQAFGHRVATTDTPQRTPTPVEVQWQAYSAIACGCRGYFAFCWTHKPGPENFISLAMPEMAPHLKALGVAYKRIAKWAPALAKATHLNYVDLPESLGSVLTKFYGQAGVDHVLVVAGPEKSVSVKIPARLYVDVEGGWPKLGIWKVSLQPGEGKLFRVIA